jgi:hypothetical protein
MPDDAEALPFYLVFEPVMVTRYAS